MPELPEVETTCRGIRPHVQGQRVRTVRVYNRYLRWPVPASLPHNLIGHTLIDVTRRAKYLLFQFDNGTLIQIGRAHV